MTHHRISFEGPSALAVQVATELAAADGIDLISSKPPAPIEGGTFRLEVVVDAMDDAVARAVGRIRDALPDGASITVAAG